MNAGSPRSLFRGLVTVLLGIGGLVLLDSGVSYAADRSLIGEASAICADDWTSVGDPQAPVPRRPETLPGSGYQVLPAPVACAAPRSIPPPSHRARAPPPSR